MKLDIRPLHDIFAAEIHGLDFSRPVGELPMDEIRAVSARYGVLILRNDRPPTDQQHVAFSKALGPIEANKLIKVAGVDRVRLNVPGLIDVGNLDPDNNILKPDSRQMAFRRGDRLWHTDMSFNQNRATWSLLAGHEIPPQGGETEFVDMRHAFEQLPKEMQTMLEQLTVEHSVWYSRQLGGYDKPTPEEIESSPGARHKLVHVHAPSGRKTLYLASHASHIIGWPLDLGRGLIRELAAFATQPQFIFRHTWRLGDVVMWDNLATMHRATEFEDTLYKRDMRRTTCREHPLPAQFAA